MRYQHTCPAEKPANEWLAENGLCSSLLLKTELLIQQAQIVAHNLIKHHTKLLTEDQITLLKKYLKASSHYNTRIRIQNKHAYKVMNIGTAINRKLFKLNRQSQAQEIKATT